MKFQVFGATSPEESNREREHRKLAREAAAEGIVLLKNDGILPIQPGKIALYGPGSRMTVKRGAKMIRKMMFIVLILLLVKMVTDMLQ